MQLDRLPASDQQPEALPLPAQPAVGLSTPRSRRWTLPTWLGVLLSNRLAVAGIVLLVLLVLLAIFAPLLTPYAPQDMIGMPNDPPSGDHWFGTTHQGQDVFSQVAYGARLSLLIGALAGVVTTVLAIAGGYAGRLPGRLD